MFHKKKKQVEQEKQELLNKVAFLEEQLKEKKSAQYKNFVINHKDKDYYIYTLPSEEFPRSLNLYIDYIYDYEVKTRFVTGCFDESRDHYEIIYNCDDLFVIRVWTVLFGIKDSGVLIIINKKTNERWASSIKFT